MKKEEKIKMNLTNSIRNHIIQAAVQKAFDERKKAFHQMDDTLIELWWRYRAGEYAETLLKLPEHLLAKETSALVYVDGLIVYLYNNIRAYGHTTQVTSADRPNPYRFPLLKQRADSGRSDSHIRPGMIAVDAEGKKVDLYEVFTKYKEEMAAIQREESKLRNDLTGFLRGVSTIKKLLDTWPEVVLIYPQIQTMNAARQTKYVVNLPACRTDVLNTAIFKTTNPSEADALKESDNEFGLKFKT